MATPLAVNGDDVGDALAAEALERHRYQSNHEFFEVSIGQAVSVLDQVGGVVITKPGESAYWFTTLPVIRAGVSLSTRGHPMTRAELIAAASLYLDGIATHDGSRVPFAPDCRRTEQARITGSSAAELRDSLARMPTMSGRRNTRFVVEERTGSVVAFTQLVLPATDDPAPAGRTYPRGSGKPTTVHLAERFRIAGGSIREIEAIFHFEIGTDAPLTLWPERD